MIDRTENAQRAAVWLLLIGVAMTGGYTMVRMYAPAFQLAQLSRDDALIASLFVVGAVMVALLLPKTLTALAALMGLSLSIAAGIAGAAALPLGLIEHAPLFWRGLLLGSVAAPFACTPLLFWNMKPTATPTRLRGNLPQFTGATDRKRITIRRPPKAIGEGSKPQLLANPESEETNETAETLLELNETIETVRKHKGNLTAAAAELKMTRQGVGERLKRLYKVDPRQVERYAPDWAKRHNSKQ